MSKKKPSKTEAKKPTIHKKPKGICHKKLMMYSTIIILLLFLGSSIFISLNQKSVLETFLEDSTQNQPTLFAIESDSCGVCNTQELVFGLREKIFKDLEVKSIHNSNNFKELIKASGTKTIPLVFFNKEIEKYDQWERIKTAFYNFTYNENTYYALDNKFLLSPKEILDKEIFQKENFLVIGEKESKNTVYIVTDFSSQFLSAMEGNKKTETELLKKKKDFTPIIPKLVNEFVETKQTNIKYINFLTENSDENLLLAHKAAECSNKQGKFKEYKEFLFLEQEKWSQTIRTKEVLVEFANEAKLNIEQFNSCLEESHQSLFDSQYSLLSSLEITGSPTIIVNDVILSGIPKYKLISLLLEEKNKLVEE